MSARLLHPRVALSIALGLLVLAGCSKRVSVWVSRKDHFDIPVETATRLIANTSNGEQVVVGVEDHGGKVVIDMDVRGGGSNRTEAQAALDAIAVSAKRDGDTIRVSWDWKSTKKPDWSAEVAYRIKLPPNLDLNLVTHNGRIVAQGISGNCVLEAHNGEIIADTTGARVSASTLNGDLNITTIATDISLETSNGNIGAALKTDGDVGGSIVAVNGWIVVTLGDSAAAMLDCSTTNGQVYCNHTLSRPLAKKTSLKGSLRGGEKVLRVETQNGTIKIQ